MPQARFLDKTLLAVVNVAQQSLFSERYAYSPGLLQSLDVRIKLASFFIILISISFLRTVEALLVSYALTLVLAVLSRVSLLFFLKRVWLFVPLFSAAIVLPALLNIVTPGDAVWVLVQFDRSRSFGPYTIPAEISVTREGISGAILFVSRVAASVSFAVLFTLTTKWHEVFSGLRALLVPRIFVVTLNMTHRYLFVLLRLIRDMYLARKSRTIRPFAPAAERSWTATRMGATFKRSLDLSEDIHKAMLSRGFHGEFRSIRSGARTVADYLWLMTAFGCSGIFLLIDRSFR